MHHIFKRAVKPEWLPVNFDKFLKTADFFLAFKGVFYVVEEAMTL